MRRVATVGSHPSDKARRYEMVARRAARRSMFCGKDVRFATSSEEVTECSRQTDLILDLRRNILIICIQELIWNMVSKLAKCSAFNTKVPKCRLSMLVVACLCRKHSARLRLYIRHLC